MARNARPGRRRVGGADEQGEGIENRRMGGRARRVGQGGFGSPSEPLVEM